MSYLYVSATGITSLISKPSEDRSLFQYTMKPEYSLSLGADQVTPRRVCALFSLSTCTNVGFLGTEIQVNLHQFSTCNNNMFRNIDATRLGQLGANISPDRSSLTPQVLIGNFLKHNYPLLYELQHINLLCLYLPKEDGVSPDAEYITQIIFSIFLQ